MIQSAAKELGRALPNQMKPERLVRIALTCIRLNPELMKCTPESFMGSLFTLAQLGLEPVAGRAYLIPFNNNRKIGGEWKSVKECQAVIGYKGLVDMFYRHEKAVLLSWAVVHEGDDFKYSLGTDAYIKHTPVQTERGKVLGYWVLAKLANGGQAFHYMTHDACMEHGQKHSKTWDKEKKSFHSSSPWAKTPEAQCLKTVLIQLAKLLPLSIEMQTAIGADETTREYRAGIDSALDLKDNANWEEEAIDVTPTATEKAPEAPKAQEAVKQAEKPATVKPEALAKKVEGPAKLGAEEEMVIKVGRIVKTERNGVPTFVIRDAAELKYFTDSQGIAEIAREAKESEKGLRLKVKNAADGFDIISAKVAD